MIADYIFETLFYFFLFFKHFMSWNIFFGKKVRIPRESHPREISAHSFSIAKEAGWTHYVIIEIVQILTPIYYF